MDDLTTDRVEQLTDYIMKNCLWQFHSRAWDRERQNKEILGKTTQLLCGEEVDLSTPADKCYWADAVILAEAYRKNYPWVAELGPDEIKSTMTALHQRLDFLTISGSLNAELTDQNY